MSEIASFVLQWLSGTLACFALILLDERRMSEPMLARAWPPVSRNAAIVFFGPLAVPIHFIRTRRNLKGALLGIVAFGSVLILSVLGALLAEAIFD